jgi:hypothetical protein
LAALEIPHFSGPLSLHLLFVKIDRALTHYIVGGCVMISIFARYVDTQRFPTSAYFNISLIYLLSLSSLGLLGLDLAYTLYARESQEEQPHSQAVSILWNVVYWGSMVTGSIFGTFLTRYWQSGHFTMSRRISHTLKVRNYFEAIF